MQMPDADYNGLLVRVERLERQSRFWKIAGVLMLAATVFSPSGKVGAQQTGANAPKPDMIVEYGQPAPEDDRGSSDFRAQGLRGLHEGQNDG